VPFWTKNACPSPTTHFREQNPQMNRIVTEIEHFQNRSCLVTATKQNLQIQFSLTGFEKVPHFRCSHGLLGTPDLVIVMEKKSS